MIIKVKDVNDETAYFIQGESFNFSNRPLPMQTVVGLNAHPNTPVFTLQAGDHNIHYFLESFIFQNLEILLIFFTMGLHD